MNQFEEISNRRKREREKGRKGKRKRRKKGRFPNNYNKSKSMKNNYKIPYLLAHLVFNIVRTKEARVDNTQSRLKTKQADISSSRLRPIGLSSLQALANTLSHFGICHSFESYLILFSSGPNPIYKHHQSINRWVGRQVGRKAGKTSSPSNPHTQVLPLPSPSPLHPSLNSQQTNTTPYKHNPLHQGHHKNNRYNAIQANKRATPLPL